MQTPRGADPSQLLENARADLQRRMRGMDFILVDEFSVVGQDMFGFMGSRQAGGGGSIERRGQ